MVRGRWTKLYDGGMYYGAPASGGGLKVTECSTKENGQTVNFVRLEIQRADSATMLETQITIPTIGLKPFIEFLKNLPGVQDDRS